MAAADTIKELPHIEVKRCTDCGARFGRDATFCPFCGVPLSQSTWDRALDPLVGKIVDARYEVLEPLGEGGMGTVYKVRHVTLNRLFAMKALRRDLATDAALSQRFIHEARATAAIKHPSVVSISDFGVLEDGIPYFVMELLVGETLAVHMRARGPLPPRDAIGIARRIADALSASHAANVIHRDLKPENVFLAGADDVRIVDFGAAKIVGGSKLTRPGVVFGTPYYMSPEQAAGQPIDGRADVYSLGILLYEMLTGRVPFEADTYMGVLTKHMFQQPPKPSEALASGVRLGALEEVVMRALEKEPSARYGSMAELRKALDDAEKKRVSDAPPARTQPLVPIGTMRLSTAERIERSVEKQLAREKLLRRKQLTTAALAMAITLLGLGSIAVFVLKGRESASVLPDPPKTARASPPPPASSPPPPAPIESATVDLATAEPRPAASAPASATAAVAKSPSPRWVPPPKSTSITKPSEPAPPPPPPPAAPKKSEDFSDPWQK
jgi:eukaryotic-like serine/threonine-protein kinase